MALFFNEDAVIWLESNGFSESDREMLIRILTMIHRRIERNEGPLVILPKDTPDNVAALAYLLDAVTDAEGNLLCFGENNLLGVPDEARERYKEGMELQELEQVTDKLRKAKLGRSHMDPRKRSSVMKD